MLVPAPGERALSEQVGLGAVEIDVAPDGLGTAGDGGELRLQPVGVDA